MQVKSIKQQKHYENFLDAQICVTEQVIIPQNKVYGAFYNNNSEQLIYQSHNQFNLRKAIYNQLLRAEQIQQKNKKKQIFTRQNMSALSKKHQSIRKKNYLQFPSRSSLKQSSLQSDHLKISQAKIIPAQSPFSKSSLLSHSHQTNRSLSRQYSQKLWVSKPQKSTSQKSTRPQTTPTKPSQIQVIENTKKYFQLRKQNPLVVYPFESHLKIKRVDENSKVLANIITKKNKIMNKLQLYEFVSKIMDRRTK